MIFRTFAAAAAVATLATNLSAATLNYDATSAQSTSRAYDNHSLWFKRDVAGIGNRFDFDPAGTYSVTDDGNGNLTANLSGMLLSRKVDGGFELNFEYDNDLSAYGTPSFKNEQGSAAIQAQFGDNYFLNLIGGSLIGTGAFDGIDLKVSARPTPAVNAVATQVGTGSNNKNAEYGLANWFFIEAGDNCDNGLFDLCALTDTANGYNHGDININLSAVPLPASVLLLLGAVGGLGVASRRRKQSA